ncbi:hypothetical protein SDC9_174347 [bioreactor metagenome]|uniref:Uncharacterized protein n=1 Tax=bioreactor metagenome TaxID=1076179 RepID=A0A645GIW7_9ZZZZ
MLVEAPPPVIGNVHVLHIKLSAHKIAIRVGQRSLACTDRFNLGSCKHNASSKALKKFVFERGPFVPDLYFAFCFWHLLKIETLLVYWQQNCKNSVNLPNEARNGRTIDLHSRPYCLRKNQVCSTNGLQAWRGDNIGRLKAGVPRYGYRYRKGFVGVHHQWHRHPLPPH